MSDTIRNIAIIAHVDHGKTTLVDQLLRQGGAFRDNQVVAERAMDSMDLEREKGITIKAKNTSVHWRDRIINIVDTPGHADFGGEVERVMRMVDGVLLLVDAYEGPMAQTRFVLRKALAEGLMPLVMINKIDREHSDPVKVHDDVLELFMELGATDEQFNAPFVYGSGRDGYALRKLNDSKDGADLQVLFETIWEHVPAPKVVEGAPFQMLVSNIDWSDYVGRIAIGKITSGEVNVGDQVFVTHRDGKKERAKITKLYEYSGLSTSNASVGVAGNIVGLSGFEDIDIGETISANADMEALPFQEIDPPTIQMQFAVNDGPLSGKEGKYVTSRQLADRLAKEQKINISININDSDTAGVFNVNARGAMQIAVLVEQMRREGFEVLVSRPTAIMKRDENGKVQEPYETLWVETPDECLGGVMSNLANRKGRIENMSTHPHGGTTIEAVISTRGLIGFEFDLINLTNGRGVMSHMFKEYAAHCGELVTRQSGTLVSMETGVSTAYALDMLEERGKLFVGAGEDIYEGMLVGENPRQGDLPVNPCKAKHLTNMRSQGDGKGIQLSPPMRFTLERAIEYIAQDEFVEATPKSLRLRKKILDSNARKRFSKQLEAV
jgi:GTP-binding protein